MTAQRAARAAALAAATALAAACTRSSHDPDLKPPPGFTAPPIKPLAKVPPGERLGFGPGFSTLEVGADGKTWHWMGPRGEIRLSNDGHSRKLHIKGWVPLELVTGPPTLRIRVHGQRLDEFVQREGRFDRWYAVPAATLGTGPTVLLTIETDKIGHAPGDPRDLGVSVEQVEWQPTN